MIEEVSNKLNEFSEDGTLATIINEQIFDEINKEIIDGAEKFFMQIL